MKKLLFSFFCSVALFGANPKVLLHTTKGDIEIELFADVAPKAVENFLTHVKEGYYNHVIFH